MTTIKWVEEIAKRDDRALAGVFFVFFSRFEYALKRAGFVVGHDHAEPDWTKFAQQHSDVLETNKDLAFVDAVSYLQSAPPKKQVIQHGVLDWTNDKFIGPFDLPRVLTLVRRVRNNLFHGGKFHSTVEADICRDAKLLNGALVILQACLEADCDVRYHFVEGLAW